MRYRRLALLLGQAFLGYLLYLAVTSTDAANKGAIWPLSTSFLVLFMLPESRLEGDTFVKAIEAIKGSSK